MYKLNMDIEIDRTQNMVSDKELLNLQCLKISSMLNNRINTTTDFIVSKEVN
mgnify:CR=1 FL=1